MKIPGLSPSSSREPPLRSRERGTSDVFDRETGPIEEIRAYPALPRDAELDGLHPGGFDYAERGYPLEPGFSRE